MMFHGSFNWGAATLATEQWEKDIYATSCLIPASGFYKLL